MEKPSPVDRSIGVAHFARQLQTDERLVLGIRARRQWSNVANPSDDHTTRFRDDFGEMAGF